MSDNDIPGLRFVARIFALLMVFTAGFASPVPAQSWQTCPTAPLTTERDFRVNLGHFACAFADSGHSLTLADVVQDQENLRFKPVPGGLVDFGYGTSRYWIAVRLQNTTKAQGTWWVTHDIPMAESLNVHLLPEGKGAEAARQILSLKIDDSFDARPIQHRHLVSEISLQAQETATLLIEYSSLQATEMPLFVETVPSFFKRTQSETVEIIALISLVLGMGMISTVYLYGLDGRPAFAYGSYVLSGVAFLVHMEGYTFQYVWPNLPTFNQIALAVISTSSVALGTFFVDRFTLSREYHPRLHLVAVLTILIHFILAIFSKPLMSEIWFKFVVLVAIVFATTWQVILAVKALRRGQSGAGFLVLGFGALAASISFGVVGYVTEGLFEQELAGRAIRLGFLFEAAAFSAAIALRVRAARRERDASLREQLRLSEERLNLSEALRKAEDDRQRAANAAARSQEALASTAHDIRQPLASLQLALSGGNAVPDRIAKSLEYLEDIVRTGLEENRAPLGTGDADPPSINAREHFRAAIVLKNIDAMFGAEAVEQGVDLRVMPCSAYLVANPLALMRIVGNLVSNALQHGQPQRIVVGCRRQSGAVRFEVHDDGHGIVVPDLARIHERGQKGGNSDGHGLGLAIVSELAEENGFSFEIASTPGGGTTASILVPTITSTASIHQSDSS